ncbi:MAG: hypothetical protein ACRECT_01330 [Thermoplasmata archaeon]
MSVDESSPAPGTGDVAPPRRRRWILPVVAVAVVVAVLFATLFATGLLALGKAHGPNPVDETFSQAEATAQSGATSVPGGPWYAVFGAAVAVTAPVLEPATNLSSLAALANCTIIWPGGSPGNIGLPATGPGAGAGAAAFWTFGLKNASNGLLVESVSGGVAAALLTAGGAACTQAVALLASFPSGIVNSPSIVATADGAGGAAFLSTYPNATRTWTALGGLSYDGLVTSPTWYLEYTICTLPLSVSEVGAVFNATLGGTSGALISDENGSADCALTAPVGLGALAHALLPPTVARKAI